MLSFSRPLLRDGSQPWPNHPVSIAFVITDLDPGGAEKALVNLVTHLDRTRWAPAVIALGGEGKLAAVVRAAGIPCECLDLNRRQMVKGIWKLAQVLRRCSPLLIQSFLFHANVASRLAALLAGRPTVVGGLRVAEHQKGWHLIVDRLTFPLSSGSICVSRGVLQFSQEIGRLSPRRLTVIPNGIDPQPFQQAEPLPRQLLGIPEGVHLALAVGRLDAQKGLPDLLDAAEWVMAKHATWHLALAGDGPLRNWLLERLARGKGLAGRVHWLGQRDDIPQLLKTADVLVLASHWEGMPNVVLEAMAAGKPVVATRVEGTEDLVIPGQSGWLVPPRAPEQLAQALLEAAHHPQTCHRLGEQGRARVTAEFSLDRTVQAYERVWAGLLNYQFPPCDGSASHPRS